MATPSDPNLARRYSAAVAKVRRLNFKLSQLEAVAKQMEQAANKGTPIPPNIVKGWVRDMKKELSRNPESKADNKDQ